MKSLFIFLSSLLVSSLASAAPSFCLQNFNVYGPVYAAQVTERTERLARELNAEPQPCEVLQFQEVWRGSHIAQVSGHFVKNYQISAPNRQANIGLMSLFHGSMGSTLQTQTYTFAINNEGGVLDNIRDISGVKKAFHIVRTPLANLPEDIYFLNTHLHPGSTSVRLTQILDIYNWRLRNQDIKLVMSGDFNSEISSFERAFLLPLMGVHDSMEEVLGQYPENFCSYCEENPRTWMRGHHLLDYVFYSNISQTPSALKPVHGEVNLKGEGKNTLSDHYGVRVYFEMRENVDATPDQEQRRTKYLNRLDEALAILSKERRREFKVYLNEILEIRQQVSVRFGPHWDYFNSFR